MQQSSGELEELRKEWSTLYRDILPSLARARDPAQKPWPVSLDHCFARIILDNTIGKQNQDEEDSNVVPWDTVIKKPAVKSMNRDQLRAAILLGKKIQQGEISLAEYDRRSLVGRGKNEQKYASKNGSDEKGQKRKRVQDQHQNTASTANRASPQKRRKSEDGKRQATLPFKTKDQPGDTGVKHDPLSSKTALKEESATMIDAKAGEPSQEFFQQVMHRICTHPSLTAYRKRLYAALLTVPRGEYTTYQALADYLDSSARAVGNGMRNNPFAPDVPCHRVLASDRSIGGFYGSWGKDGKYADKKIELLKGEGIKFDSKGLVRGPVWSGFHELYFDSNGNEAKNLTK